MSCKTCNWLGWQFTDFWLGLVYKVFPRCIFLSLHSDQFCSLVYSFSNLYFIGCLYTRYFPNVPSYATTSPSPSLSMATLKVLPRYLFSSSLVERDGGLIPEVLSSAYDPDIQHAWDTCGTEHNWAPYFVLATLPFMVRFLQSLRRYWDSKLPTHLINVSLDKCIEGQLTSECAGWQVRRGYGVLFLLFPLETRW